jgi:protein-disulfide isomerase
MKNRFAVLLLVLISALAWSQQNDACALKPPKGASVALFEYEDLQCPDCARAAPLMKEAARAYKIPHVRRDFPLQKHSWARQAAIFARFFDTKSKKVGDQFRDYIYAHQPEINPENLRSFAEKFAEEQKIALPLVLDPQGDLERKVAADLACGIRNNVQHTPTIYVVSNKETGTPFVEVVDRSELFRLIDDMKRQASAAKPATKKPKSPAKPSGN